MKKNIEVVGLDRGQVEALIRAAYRAFGDGTSELCRGLEDMLDGTCESLLLELDGGSGSTRPSCIKSGELEIYIQSRRVLRGKEEILLTPKEFDILCLLAKNKGQVFTKEQIYQQVWETSYMLDSSNVMAFIRKLRKKIERNPDSPQYILTIWGIGYKFNENPDPEASS